MDGEELHGGLYGGTHGEDTSGELLHEPEWLATNRDLWDERAGLHADSDFYDLDGLVAGADRLRPWEDAELGPVDGLDVIHLQCHIGTDTVGLARRGAQTVGLDISPESLKIARQLADDCGLTIEWVESDVYTADAAVSGRTFDVVYTGFGALGWLPDLEQWADVVANLLHRGGYLYVTEIHPMWGAMIEDGRTLCQDAIDADFMPWDMDGTYADPEARFRHTLGYERLHTTADLLTAVLDAGLRIELYHEYDRTPAPAPWLERGPDGLFTFPDGHFRFPLAYSLRASKT
jgi:SAM-dependent methyltransferase